MKKITLIAGVALFFTSCAVVRPGEVGMKSKFGKLSEPKENGLIGFNPFVAKVIKLPTQTVNREVLINLPSKEGLTIKSEISILYRINPKMAKKIVTEIGLKYDQIITSVFRSASADVTSKFFAKDMHSGERDKIEKEIARKMNEILNEKGFEVEAVLMKSITLPDGLAKAIEAKLEAEQLAQRMEFILISEQKEAERKKIEAEGTRDAQKILSEGLTDKILQLRQIEMMGSLTNSTNAKIIVTNGNQPVLIKE
jgi:regulator of protease activity HflC (stomatin/prohibitin superfamily)